MPWAQRGGSTVTGGDEEVEKVQPWAQVECVGQLAHRGTLVPFPHHPLLEHLVDLFFQPVTLVVMVDLIDLGLGEGQFSGTALPVPAQVGTDGVQVLVCQACAVRCRDKWVHGQDLTRRGVGGGGRHNRTVQLPAIREETI